MRNHPQPVPDGTFWRGRRVLITGHTGFKGQWLALWLGQMGAPVWGYARSERAQPFADVTAYRGDICDAEALQTAVQAAQPEVIFHLAAQPLVRRAFHDPVDTYRTNIVGTANLLNCARQQACVRAVLVVTTDKCYEPQPGALSFREDDRLGGSDPYSNSKACMELVTHAFAQSYWPAGGAGIATARTGNLIGGGDWAEDRLIPDLMRRFAAGQPPTLRNPQALRPWQYVLEVLRGYLLLAERLVQAPRAASGAWNFGPEADGVRPVGWVAEQLARAWGMAAQWSTQPGGLPQEIPMLQLDCSKASARLNWRPLLPLEVALAATARWYRQAAAGADVRQVSQALLAEYCAQIGELAGVPLLTGVDA